MAKRDKKPRPAKLTRKYRSRVAREQRQTRYLLIGTGVVIALVVLLVAAGLFKTQVADPAATRSAKERLKSVPAVTVNGTEITIADWQARVRYERQLRINQIAQINQQLSFLDPSDEFQQQLITQAQAQVQEIQNMLQLGDGIAADVLDQMVEEQLIRQEAAQRGIVVTPEELQRYIEINLFGFPFPPTPEPVPTIPPPTLAPTATVTPEPTLTPTTPPTPRSREDFEADYAAYTQQIAEITEMTEEGWRAMIEGQLYREKLMEVMGAEVETELLQALGNYIVAQDLNTANALLGRLDAGEGFEALVEEIQADESEEPQARAGSFGWATIETLTQRFGDQFARVAFDAEPGTYSRTAVSAPDGGFYLIYVGEREVRALTEVQLEQRRQDMFESWLEQQKLGEGIVYGNWREYIPREPSLS
jgi:parvulin-like peptidyl-prolyl isomerase